MADRVVTVDFVGEDRRQDLFLRALFRRMRRGRDGLRLDLRFSQARGGAGLVREQLGSRSRVFRQRRGDILVAMLDANGAGWVARRRELTSLVERFDYTAKVVACPDPEIEAWYVVDRDAWRAAFGVEVTPRPGARAKQTLADAIAAGQPATVDDDTVIHAVLEHSEPSRLARLDRSFKDFFEQLESALARLLDP